MAVFFITCLVRTDTTFIILMIAQTRKELVLSPHGVFCKNVLRAQCMTGKRTERLEDGSPSPLRCCNFTVTLTDHSKKFYSILPFWVKLVSDTYVNSEKLAAYTGSAQI